MPNCQSLISTLRQRGNRITPQREIISVPVLPGRIVKSVSWPLSNNMMALFSPPATVYLLISTIQTLFSSAQMHIPDGFLSVTVSLGLWALSLLAVGYALKRVSNDLDAWHGRQGDIRRGSTRKG